jgi:AcrR family transcriptional regulator
MPRARRTQEERTATMRARLVDATVATLFDRGYARTTTTEIARRARVSRGAQLHHFRTKAELVTTAVEHLFQRRTGEFRAAMDAIPAGADRLGAAINLLWSMISSPTFYAWLEVIVAARTDGRLRRTVAALGARFARSVEDTFAALFPTVEHRAVPHFAFALLQGLAVDRIVVPDAPHIPAVLEGLALLGRLVISEEEGR